MEKLLQWLRQKENPLGDEVKTQAEDYAVSPQAWYGLWFEKLIPLVYMANGNKIYFKNMLEMQRGYLVERLLKWYLLSNGI